MKTQPRVRWMIAVAGILLIAPGMVWADRAIPKGPEDAYHAGPVNMARNHYDLEEGGPIEHPPDESGPRTLDKVDTAQYAPTNFGTSADKSGGGLSTGSGSMSGPSKADVVEKSLRRVSKQLR